MKKSILFVALAIMAASIFFTSCEKYEQSTPYVISDSLTATISGIVYADLDLNVSTAQYAPQGTVIYIKANLSDLVPNYSGNNMKIYTTTVGANGAYSIKVPVNDAGVMYYVSGDEFTYDQKQYDNSLKRTIFYTNESSTDDLYSNQHYFLDINYNY